MNQRAPWPTSRTAKSAGHYGPSASVRSWILAYSPQARGRSERAFGTIQGRLPQELRHQCINDYATANHYLEQHFIPDFNRRFTIKPAQPESAFVKLTGIELELVLSSKHERVVR